MFFCLDDETGEILWEKRIGIGDRLRASPVYAEGVVACGSLYEDGGADVQKVNAWDVNSEESLWTIQLNSSGKMLNGPSGCAGEGIMFFTGGGEIRPREGEIIVIAPRTGEILWRTSKAYASQTGTPSYRDGKIYLPGAYKLPIPCLSAQKGEIGVIGFEPTASCSQSRGPRVPNYCNYKVLRFTNVLTCTHTCTESPQISKKQGGISIWGKSNQSTYERQ